MVPAISPRTRGGNYRYGRVVTILVHLLDKIAAAPIMADCGLALLDSSGLLRLRPFVGSMIGGSASTEGTLRRLEDGDCDERAGKSPPRSVAGIFE